MNNGINKMNDKQSSSENSIAICCLMQAKTIIKINNN